MTPERLRRHAVTHSLFAPRPLDAAIERLGFVQADPIRSPARAQDLILRHRVDGYRAGELERRYPSLGVEEDYLYAYGFLRRSVWQLLHPRRTTPLVKLDERVLETVRRLGATHPRDLEAEFGSKRVINAWGGFSKETKRALERLHHRGLLRVVGRESGVRIYQAAPPVEQPLQPHARLRGLVLAVAELLAPVPERTLRAIASRLRAKLRGSVNHLPVIAELYRTGALERHVVDGLAYVWPPSEAPEEPRDEVRFLAPFDPLVWDRRRFEHLWQWSYRFEAYTPIKKRVRGYYAMPLLWRDRVIGWANVGAEGASLDVEVGFVGKRPKERAFQRELDAEIARMTAFLGREG
jgi:uncharacterized protein YcaQ